MEHGGLDAEMGRFLAHTIGRPSDHELDAARRVGREQALEAHALLRSKASFFADSRHHAFFLPDAREELLVAEHRLQTSTAAAAAAAAPSSGEAHQLLSHTQLLASTFAASAMAHLGALPRLRAPLNNFVAATLITAGAHASGRTDSGGSAQIGRGVGDLADARARVEGAFDTLMAAVRTELEHRAADSHVEGRARTPQSNRRTATATEVLAEAGVVDSRHLALAAQVGRRALLNPALAAWRRCTFALAARQRMRTGAVGALLRRSLRRGWRALLTTASRAPSEAYLLSKEARVCAVLETVRNRLAHALQPEPNDGALTRH
ncbi:hypothetical protein T492DRAFT_1148858 [Pavlovales sp. CCMP2436]|nr:hypothetical protein T492DRAFT_1148858 [Pavlovales sp. CCMP2436]